MPAPHHSVFLQAGCPSCRPTNSVKALKTILVKWKGMENQHRHPVCSNSVTAAAPTTAGLQHVECGASFAMATRALRTCPQVGC